MKYRFLLSVLCVCLVFSCDTETHSDTSKPSQKKSYNLSFTKKQNTGVNFKNTVPESKELNHFIWDSVYNGGGVGVGDFNNDGLTDIYLSANFGPDKIYINKGNFKFEDITATAGINKSNAISSGVNVVDVNKDGLVDIYLCKFGYSQNPEDRKNELYINNGDLTFTESAKKYGVDNGGYSVSSSFFDYDKDGDLDLYVMNQPSNARSIRQSYFKPGVKESSFVTDYTSDCLYENNGNNTFSNVGKSSGIRNFAYGLGLVTADLNQDGWTDIFVANDYDKPDFQYINQKDGTFKEEAKKNFDHISNFSMGADVEDLNGDEKVDIAVLDMAAASHYRSKTNMPSMSSQAFWDNVDKGYHLQYMHNVLHLNQGNGQYSEVGHGAGIAKTDWSWSLLINDFNQDGHEDIYITNGIKRDIRNNDYIENTKKIIERAQGNISDIMKIVNTIPSNPISNYLFINDGNMHFDDKASSVGLGDPGFTSGAAYADLDNDGDLDLITNNVDTEASIFENNSSSIGNYVRVKLNTSSDNRSTLNSIVTVYSRGVAKRKELVNTRGFLSTSEPVLHFGLGGNTKIDSMTIVWPDNNVSVLLGLEANKLHTIDQSNTKKVRRYRTPKAEAKYIAEVSQLNTKIKHSENQFDAYGQQLLLPYEVSEIGPFIEAGDLNGDGKDDLVVGGAFGQETKVLLQSGQDFSSANLAGSATYEDGNILIFDANGDGHQDLYLCSGGYEIKEGDNKLTDRLYINNGSGSFQEKKITGTEFNSAKAIAVDIDGDNDKDVFVFGRVKSGEYPKSPKSILLENDGSGNFKDVTEAKAKFLSDYGMVTDATSLSENGKTIIYTVGEWSQPKAITVSESDITVSSLGDNVNGLWFAIEASDIDQDGDTDLLLGNMGKNVKFKASKEKPFKVYASDFDKNGKCDVVLASYHDGKEVPLRGRQCSSEQVPEVAEKFRTFEAFATASLAEVYNLNDAESYEVQTLESGILRNQNGSWSFEPFPFEAQFFPTNAIEVTDVNNDGLQDVITVGNLYAMEVETTRLDAGKGLVMLQKKDGSFDQVPPYVSGLYARGDAKDMVKVNVGGQEMLAVTMNNDYMKFFALK